MNIDEFITALVRRFGDALSGNLCQLRCFHVYGVQVEGWFKGELLYFLDSEKKMGTVADFDREVRIDLGMRQKRVDLKVSLEVQGERRDAWIELKHWALEQKGTSYRPQFYFGDLTSVGIRPDIEALSKLGTGFGYCLILMTANPGLTDWMLGIEKFNEKFRPLTIESLTSPVDFPDAYHLGLLKVGSPT